MEESRTNFKLVDCGGLRNQSEFSSSDNDESLQSEGLTQNVNMPADVQASFTVPGISCLGQASIPDLGQHMVVLSSHGSITQKNVLSQAGEPSTKRICLEQDGQTFVLTGLSLAPQHQSQPVTQTNEIIGPSSKDTDVNQAWFTSREDKTSLQRKGHLWKQGTWSKEEIDLLQDNINLYCQEHDISDPATVIFQMSKDERKDFYRTVAKGLNRPLFSVYRRVIRMYDNKNHVGKYTDDELEQLKELRSIHGNDWVSIAAILGRSASSIKDRCRLLKENCNQGKWLPVEERQLAEAVYDLAKVVPGEMISSGLSWASVAERVGTRSEKQCRTKWLNFLNWKEAGGTLWTRDDDVALICKVCSLNVAEESLVDWSEMAQNWSSVRSPQWLRSKWWALKQRYAPKECQNSFPETCDYLYQHCAQKVCVKDEVNAENLVSASIAPQPKLACAPTLVTIPSRPILTRPALAATTLNTPTHFLNSITPSLTAPSTANSFVGDLSNLVGTTTPVGINPVIQTIGLPTGLPLNPTALAAEQTFLLTHGGQSGIPLTATLGPTGQIIIQTIGDNVQMNEAMAFQLNTGQQIIISTSGAIMGSLITNPSCPESLLMPLHSIPDSSRSEICLELQAKDDEVDDDDDLPYSSEEGGSYVDNYDDEDTNHLGISNSLTQGDCFASDKGNRLIVSDVMLASSGSPSDIDKDSLDHVPGSSES